MTKTAIVIDDDEISVLLLSNALKLSEFEVISASNGIGVCELISQHKASCVICDIFMPEMDGIETITAIRKINSSVLIVAITAYDVSYINIAKKLGANLVFHKSEPPLSIVNNILEKINT